ncbi:hypothetical protein H257_03047 [Aphanomyces astaci]|uniref:Uncharacterized protein n=1 Tax=Aphanomyces astaci TaxID=112090 RepID=W4GZS3_APHAT|nr:hypothetical protein H257_03047 [Aphanomyces astaci]ETV85235.1 hypothetical protein H257_03047 [Aphanomyces astaci]|eukprot:XP_009825253.1 hypothetical protein H257_03047 [Aphanomyces astaci]
MTLLLASNGEIGSLVFDFWNTINIKYTLRGWGQLVDGTKVNPELLEVGVTAWDNVDCAFSVHFGDAGDALTVASANGDDHLVAVFSWSVECDAQGVPGVYTRLSKVRSFVEPFVAKVSPRYSF